MTNDNNNEGGFINQQTIAEEPRIIRRHFLDLLFPFIWSVVMLVPVVLAYIILSGSNFAITAQGNFGIWMFGGLYIVFVISFFTTQWIFWYQDAWIITHDRLIDVEVVALFNRRMSQLSFNQVQDVRVEIKGYLQNIFDYGTVSVQSAGRQSFFELHSIPHPSRVSSEISDKSLLSQKPVSTNPEVRVIKPTQRLGEMLVAEGRISQEDLVEALQNQTVTGHRLGQILVARGKLTSQELAHALAGQYKIPSIDLSRYDLDGATVRLIPKAMAEEHLAVAVDRSPDGVISIAMAQPSADKVTAFMEQFDSPLTFLVADEDYIKEVIRGYYSEND
jgi:hypothetical protein